MDPYHPQGYTGEQETEGSNSECPSAPTQRTIPLPPVLEVYPPVPIIIRSDQGQPLPEGLLIRGIETSTIDLELAFTMEQRPLVRPIATSLPGYTGHLWGAAGSRVQGGEAWMTVHFDDIARPATSPPLGRLIIIVRDRASFITVEPRGIRGYVTVGDVQQAVAGWMRGVEQAVQGQDGGQSFSRRIMIHAYGAPDIEVEVWVWRGLVGVPAGTHLWVMEL